MFKSISLIFYRWFFAVILLLWLAALPSHSMAQETVVRVLGVPGYDLLLQDLKAAGYSATLYGPADRPTEGFEVFSIGSLVPAAQAIEILNLAKKRIPSLRYIVLTGDRSSAAGGPGDVFVGSTSRSMDQFAEAAPLSDREFTNLVQAGLERPDLFYESVRATYLRRQWPPEASGSFFIRDDGVVVVPAPDGSATLYAGNGARGNRTAEGSETWPMVNLAPIRPARQGGAISQEWLNQMNRWLEAVSDRLMRDLELLLPSQESIDNYRAYEEKNANNLYDRVYLRRQYLSLVIDQMFPREDE